MNNNFNKSFPKINFIGNKEKIAEWICENFPSDAKSIFDAFSGGASISYFAKQKGLRVISNDILNINYQISKSLIENNFEKLNKNDIKKIFSGNPLKGFMYNARAWQILKNSRRARGAGEAVYRPSPAVPPSGYSSRWPLPSSSRFPPAIRSCANTSRLKTRPCRSRR